MPDKSYIAIDLNELKEVNDSLGRTAKTICLAATPTLKSYDVKGV